MQSMIEPETSRQSPRIGSQGKQQFLSLALSILCLMLAALGLRPTIVSVGPLLPEIVTEFGLSHVQASLLTTIPTLLMGLLALPSARLAARYGRDRIIVAALLILATATMARAVSTSSWELFLSTAGTGVGIACAGALIPGFVKAGFPTRAALLMGIYAMALSLGSSIAAATTGLLADRFGGWRPAFGFWTIPALIGAGAWMMVASRTRNVRSTPGAGHGVPLPTANRTAWLVATFFSLNNVIFYGCIAWLAPIYVEQGHSASHAGLLLASFTLAFMAGTLALGVLSRHVDRRTWLALSATSAFLGILWMTLAPAMLPFVAVSLTAFGIGGSFTLAMTLPLDNATTQEEAVAWNVFALLVSYPVGASGPVLIGILRDLTGSFATSLAFLTIASGAMLALTPFLRPHHLSVRRAFIGMASADRKCG